MSAREYEAKRAMLLRIAKEHQRRADVCVQQRRLLDDQQAEVHPGEFVTIRLVSS